MLAENICEREDFSHFKRKLEHIFKEQIDCKYQSQRHVWFIHFPLVFVCAGLL